MSKVDISGLFHQVGSLGLSLILMECITFDFMKQNGILVISVYLTSCTWLQAANLKHILLYFIIYTESLICNLVDTKSIYII